MHNGVPSNSLHLEEDSSITDDSPTPHLLRHVTSIQVRNLTPFPVRDAFASALTQPSVRPQSIANGATSDDLDITVGRRRRRKVSNTSLHAPGGLRADACGDHSAVSVPIEGSLRRRTSSKASATAGIGTGAGSPSSTFSSRRPPHRTRTGSTASFGGSRRTESLSGTSAMGLAISATPSRIFSSHSQLELEKVVNSRLVETFITATVPQPPTSPPIPDCPRLSKVTCSLTPPESPLRSPLRTAPPTRTKAAKPHHSPSSSVNGKQSTRAQASTSTPTRQAKREVSPRTPTQLKKRHSKSESVSMPSLPKHVHSSSVSLKFPEQNDTHSVSTPVPNYISPIHRPSTNPSFSLNELSSSGVMGWTDLSQTTMKVELWGRVGTGWGIKHKSNGKGKERDTRSVFESDELEWMVLESWDVNLSELIPLPEHIASHPARLPSNTLLVHLSPPDKLHLVPPSSASRPGSPGGHNSDPEINSSSKVQTSELFTFFRKDQSSDVGVDRRDRNRGRHVREPLKTAGWHDLLNLTTLQAIITDTKQSLLDVERKIDYFLLQDESSVLKREVSERECWISSLHLEREKTDSASNELRNRISLHKQDMRQRREALLHASQIFDNELQDIVDLEDVLQEERNRLISLRGKISRTRTTLLTTLSGIFPIDLLSPPDLLYTILAVPLPIPLSATDPAPPLSLASHKEVTEDGVATALGYAAQVVHLMAVYLGKVLVYPVTCVGSRSLIKDGISAMVGPRMFPLFSKSVDTYRFEYGVFLLNKDIEILMADKDLRALDMRHTLPNLKNLLLTLTNGEGASIHAARYSNSCVVPGLQSPPGAASPPAIELTPNTPPVSPQTEHPEDSDSPINSGSTTPTKSSVETIPPRKSRAFLGLTPFAGFLRSSIRSTTSKEPTSTTSSETETEAVMGEASYEGGNEGCGGNGEKLEEGRDDEAVAGITVG